MNRPKHDRIIHAPLTRQRDPYFQSKPTMAQTRQDEKSVQHTIIQIKSYDEWQKLVASKPKVVLDAFTSWCGPCKKVAALLTNVSRNPLYKDICFVKCDIDQVTEVADQFEITSVPVVLFFQNGVLDSARTVTGFNEKLINSHLSTFRTL